MFSITNFLGAAWVKPVGILLGVLGIASAGAYANGVRWELKYQKLNAEYVSFSNGVAKLGEQAKAKNALIAFDDIKKKERVDDENARRHTADINTILRLRRDADGARRSFVPPASAGAARPDLACFDRTALESALRELVTEVRGFVDEGAAATIDLDTAKIWNQERDKQ